MSARSPCRRYEVAFLPRTKSAGDFLFIINRVVDGIFIIDIVCRRTARGTLYPLARAAPKP